MLRNLGLLQLLDGFRFLLARVRKSGQNRNFKRNYPAVILPPDYLMYESFQLDYARYYLNGLKTAEWLISLVEKHQPLEGARILDWGCGPARVIRHLPGLLSGVECYGTDYNKKTISWCSATFNRINFHSNDLMPGMIYEPDFFDLVYGISIFTHLSEKAHDAWLNELFRVLKTGGILLLTLHGQSFLNKLTKPEEVLFNSGRLVVRGRVKEGHRTYTAFHPPQWVEQWLTGATVLEHIPGTFGRQDVWIVKKSAIQPL